MPTSQASQASAQALAEVAAGLDADHASISPKFLYDELGSHLFEAICELDEYYPTRTEAAIFRRHAADIAHAIGAGSTMIDLGAGNCAKAASLFPLLHPAQYVPIDISADFLEDAVESLRQRFPYIEMSALPLDFSAGLDLPATVSEQKRLFFYPGSSIGNFTPAQAHDLLARMRGQCGADGGILIGMDLVKDAGVLNAAYDDAVGVTSAFNLNVLRHLNRLVGTDFDVRQWRHVAFYNPTESRVEMHLEAIEDTTVSWPGGRRSFMHGERIHTENSYKYRKDAAVALLAQAGFRTTDVWTDDDEWFAVLYARAEGTG
ncbi:L-histidine N(alpha)-methyltransferase [Pseudoduganella sp. GCM10020061]|uniref:L-histidine N(alpha)-methyltransferase n=1 Tax=Pseudoduganella sp. GCM10020061 TaxID=3317345 RepID=UPI003640CCC9